MTFKDAQTNGFLKTEQILATREKELVISYRNSYREIDKQLKNLYLKIQESGIPKGEYFNYITKFNRLEALKAAIEKEYNQASNIVRNTIVNSSRIAITNNYYLQQYILEWVDPDAVFILLPQEVVEVSALGTPEVWSSIRQTKIDRISATFGPLNQYQPQAGTLIESLLNNKTQSLNRIRRTITQNLIQGNSYAKMTRDIKSIMNTSTANALRIAVTEGNRNMNAGALANTEKARSQGVKIVRAWNATLDSKTRQTHVSADGREEDASGNFTVGSGYGPYPGQLGVASESINCRCTTIDKVDGVSPELRRARDPVTGKTDIINYKSFNTWADENNLKYTSRGWIQKS